MTLLVERAYCVERARHNLPRECSAPPRRGKEPAGRSSGRKSPVVLLRPVLLGLERPVGDYRLKSALLVAIIEAIRHPDRMKGQVPFLRRKTGQEHRQQSVVCKGHYLKVR